MALSDVQPLSWYQNWQNAAPSLGWQYRDEGDYSRRVLPGGGEEGSTKALSFDETGQPIGIDTQKAYRGDLAKQGYVPFSSMEEIQHIAQVAKDAYGRPFYGNVNAFLNYGFGQGSQLVQDPVHGLMVKAGNPQMAIEPAAVIYPQPQGGGFLDNIFDIIGNVGPAIIPSLLVPGGQFMALKTGLGSLADYVVKGALQGALQGGNLEQIIQSGVLGGASGEFSNAIAPTVKDALASVGITNPDAVKTAVSSVTSGVKEALFGQGSPLQKAIQTGLRSSIPQIAAELSPAPVTDATYSPTEQVSQLPESYRRMFAQADTGTMTDVSGSQEQPQDVLRIEEPARTENIDISTVINSGERIKQALTGLISFGQSLGIPVDGPNLAALGGEYFGGASTIRSQKFGFFSFGGTLFLKDLTSDLSYGILHVGDSIILENPETKIQVILDPQSSKVLDQSINYAANNNLVQQGTQQDVGVEGGGGAGWVSGEELPTGEVTPTEQTQEIQQAYEVPSAPAQQTEQPVTQTPYEPVLQTDIGPYQVPVSGTPYATTGATEIAPGSTVPGAADQYTAPSSVPGDISGEPVVGPVSGPSYGPSEGPGAGPSEGPYAGPGEGTGVPGEPLASLPDVPELPVPGEPTPPPSPTTAAKGDVGGIPGIGIQPSYGGYTTPARQAARDIIMGSYLGRGLVTSPEIDGGAVMGTKKGKRQQVWNIESLREVLGV